MVIDNTVLQRLKQFPLRSGIYFLNIPQECLCKEEIEVSVGIEDILFKEETILLKNLRSFCIREESKLNI